MGYASLTHATQAVVSCRLGYAKQPPTVGRKDAVMVLARGIDPLGFVPHPNLRGVCRLLRFFRFLILDG